MSKKHYIAIAKALHEIKEKYNLEETEYFPYIVNTLADVFFDDNLRFDYARFRKAVYEGGK